MQILEAQQRLAAGEQFATVATQMSEDKARQGGDLGWKRRQEVVGAFADAAFKLEVTGFDLLHMPGALNMRMKTSSFIVRFLTCCILHRSGHGEQCCQRF